jgi:hypothetical protein
VGLTVTQLVLLNPQLVNNPGKTCKVAIGQSLCKGEVHMILPNAATERLR